MRISIPIDAILFIIMMLCYIISGLVIWLEDSPIIEFVTKFIAVMSIGAVIMYLFGKVVEKYRGQSIIIMRE